MNDVNKPFQTPGTDASRPDGYCQHKCPFGNGDSQLNGVRWIQATTDRLTQLEKDVQGIQEEIDSVGSDVQEVKQDLTFWARMATTLVGIPSIVILIIKIFQEISVLKQ